MINDGIFIIAKGGNQLYITFACNRKDMSYRTICSMDAITKWMVADYPIGQMMWTRYAVFCLFAWLVVRRRGLRSAWRTTRPWLQGGRALLAVVESAVFVLAFRYLPLADTHAVAATSPLIVIALGAERVAQRVVVVAAGVGVGDRVVAGLGGVGHIVDVIRREARRCERDRQMRLVRRCGSNPPGATRCCGRRGIRRWCP